MNSHHATALILAAVLAAFPGRTTPVSAFQAPDTEAAARALVPLLKSVRERLQPRLGIQPGTLPPSPFTGRQSTVVAVRIGEKEVSVEPKVREALDRLLAWNQKMTPDSPDAILFDHWLDRVKIKATTVAPPGSTSIECDTQCAINRFTELGEAFGPSRKDREEMRDQLLLDALIDAVGELEP
jgi:hypothetical protein